MLKRIIFIVISLSLLTACDDKANNGKNSIATEPKELSALERYQHQANNLLISIRTKRAAEVIVSESKLLVAQSQALISEFILSNPQCNEYLSALNKAVKTMATLSREELVSDYQKGHKLPSFSSPICYHAKYILVYPAIVQVIALKGMEDIKAYQDTEKKMVTAIAHFDVLKSVDF